MSVTGMDQELKQTLAAWREKIDAALEQGLTPPSVRPQVIHEAMRYSVFAGGKRIRPILAIAAATAIGGCRDELLEPFAALELIHTYSLVHDDLPALDNDDYRRGRKTSHVVFGEAMAILAGDALLTEAFVWLSRPIKGVPADRQLRAISAVATAVDSKGMIGGQVADIESERAFDGVSDPELLRSTLDFIHENKTGKLLTASVLLGGILAGADETKIELLEKYGKSIGLAFQIVDDLLDIESTSEELGKTAGKDEAQGKLTYPALWGADKARKVVAELLATATATADMISPNLNYLGPLARYVCERRS